MNLLQNKIDKILTMFNSIVNYNLILLSCNFIKIYSHLVLFAYIKKLMGFQI
jgi:hypothetical protein